VRHHADNAEQKVVRLMKSADGNAAKPNFLRNQSD
jgi:hypothetical protein